jgi:hypothetical protein
MLSFLQAIPAIFWGNAMIVAVVVGIVAKPFRGFFR